MVKLSDLNPAQRHYVMGADRYCTLSGEVYDMVVHRFVTADDIEAEMS